MPETGQSFALIYSIEDPLGNTDQAGVGLQVRCFSDPHYICSLSAPGTLAVEASMLLHGLPPSASLS